METKGYNISGVEISSNVKKIIYSNGEGNVIYYESGMDINSLAVDDEEVIEKKVFLHDSWGKVKIKGKMIYVIWEDGNNIYMLSSDAIGEEALIKMMDKSIKISVEG